MTFSKKFCGKSPFKSDDDYKTKVKNAKDLLSKKDSVDNVILKFKQDYIDKHGSSSGGTDAEWKKYQQGLTNIRKGYN
jgi:hypothetical protein|tara:strand:+ start:491 stop:724 length:234 start_codon:yes stop_codon:yes gene_type:complete